MPVPKPTLARTLLREISKGTSAFGGTMAKREIAGRPAAPYGRLREMRPGEYLLLDPTRLVRVILSTSAAPSPDPVVPAGEEVIRGGRPS